MRFLQVGLLAAFITVAFSRPVYFPEGALTKPRPASPSGEPDSINEANGPSKNYRVGFMDGTPPEEIKQFTEKFKEDSTKVKDDGSQRLAFVEWSPGSTDLTRNLRVPINDRGVFSLIMKQWLGQYPSSGGVEIIQSVEWD